MFDKNRMKQLSPEQLVTARRWELEAIERAELIASIRENTAGTPEEYNKKLHEPNLNRCEHGEDAATGYFTCIECIKIRKILFPDSFAH